LPPALVRPAAAIWRGGVPPASVWPAAALRVGGGGGKEGVHLLLLRRRRRQDRRRVLGAGIVRGGMPPASVWPAAALQVLEGGRAREASTCFCFAAGVGETGGACSRRASCGAGFRRRRYGRRRLCVSGRAGGRGRVLELSGPSPAFARPAAFGARRRPGVLVCCRRRSCADMCGGCSARRRCLCGDRISGRKCRGSTRGVAHSW